MFSGGSSSAVAIAQQYLAQEKGVIFMCALTHSNDTTGKDRRRYGFRHFFNAYMSGQALAPILAKQYGKDRQAFHLTADYTWGHTQYESMKAVHREGGLDDRRQHHDAARHDRLQPVPDRGAEQRRRRAGAQPLRPGHGQLADPGGALRHARPRGGRQADGGRGAALQPADGPGRRRREHRGHPRHDQLAPGRWTTRAPRRSSRRSRTSTRRRRRRRRRPPTSRPCSTPTRSSAPAPSTRPR